MRKSRLWRQPNRSGSQKNKSKTETVFFITHEKKYDPGEKIRIKELNSPEYRGRPEYGHFILPVQFSNDVKLANDKIFPIFVHWLVVDPACVKEDENDSNLGFISKDPVVKRVEIWTNSAYHGISKPRVETRIVY